MLLNRTQSDPTACMRSIGFQESRKAEVVGGGGGGGGGGSRGSGVGVGYEGGSI